MDSAFPTATPPKPKVHCQLTLEQVDAVDVHAHQIVLFAHLSTRTLESMAQGMRESSRVFCEGDALLLEGLQTLVSAMGDHAIDIEQLIKDGCEQAAASTKGGA